MLDVGLGVGLLLAAELLVGGLVALAVGIDADRLLALLVLSGVLVATLHGGDIPAGGRADYIESGADTPRSASARAIVRCVATHSRSRRSSTASGSEPTTWQSR